jgi:hypothetical protein
VPSPPTPFLLHLARIRRFARPSALVDFHPVDPHRTRCGDADPHLLAVDGKQRYPDPAVDDDLLAFSSREN